MNVRLTDEQKIKILNANDVYDIMQKVLLRQNKIRRAQEHFWVIGLKQDNSILFIELISIGSQNRAYVSPPDVFRIGIYKMAVSIILVHNHPSGDLKVSIDDKKLTDRLFKVGKVVKIEVLDHFIISESDYVSFKEKGIIDDIKNNGFYEVVEQETEYMKSFKLKIEKEKSDKEARLDIARRLKALNADTDYIKKATGLTKRDIDKA